MHPARNRMLGLIAHRRRRGGHRQRRRGAPLASGAPAPAFQLDSADGKAVDLAELKGQVVHDQFLGQLVRALPQGNADPGAAQQAVSRQGPDADRRQRRARLQARR